MASNNKHPVFKDLHSKRYDLFIMYVDALSVFSENIQGEKMNTILQELTGNEYDLSDSSSINKAISDLSKFRDIQKNNLRIMALHLKDYKRELNSISASLMGLRIIELTRNGVASPNISQILEYELDESNPDGRAIRSLRIAENELVKTIYELCDNRFKCEAICKVIKSLVSKLHRRRALLQRPS